MSDIEKKTPKHVLKGDAEYAQWIRELSERYQRSQIKAAVAVNSEMLVFHWSLGRDIVTMHAESKWGSGFFKTLSGDLRREIPNAKGFSQRNLLYMKQFYEMFPELVQLAPQLDAHINLGQGSSITPQLDARLQSDGSERTRSQLASELFAIPWGHIKLLCDKCKGDRAKAEFYIHEAVQNNWSRAVLLNFLDSALYERKGKAVSNFERVLPEPQSDLAQQMTKDPYQFDFLAIREGYDEKELKDALVDNIARFLLELGTGFAFMGREYRIEIGDKEKFIDMLFYHTRLRCYVVLEVKVTEFDPAYMGQLGTYVVAVNRQLKNDADSPTIGLLVCKSLDKVEAQYALESSSQPIGVSGYELAKLIPEDLMGSLPTIEEIEAELGRFDADPVEREGADA